MTETIILDGCNCVCENAELLVPKPQPSGPMKIVEIALIVVVIILVIIGLIIGFNKLKKEEDEHEGTYY